jgi:hypothetical protein
MSSTTIDSDASTSTDPNCGLIWIAVGAAAATVGVAVLGSVIHNAMFPAQEPTPTDETDEDEEEEELLGKSLDEVRQLLQNCRQTTRLVKVNEFSRLQSGCRSDCVDISVEITAQTQLPWTRAGAWAFALAHPDQCRVVGVKQSCD